MGRLLPPLSAAAAILRGHAAPGPTGGAGNGRVASSLDVDMMPEVQAAAVRRPSRLASVALVAIGAGFFVFLGATALISLDEVTRAEGKVIPSSQNQVVAHLYGGIVEDILVREGDVVKAGQPLLKVDNREAQADYRETQTRVLALMARAARLTAESQKKIFVVMPPEVVKGAPDAALRERELFRARRESLESEVKGLAEQLKQREQELRQQESAVTSLERRVASLRSELAAAMRVGSQTIGRFEILRLQRETRDLAGELATERLKIPRAQAAIVEARQKIGDRRNTFMSETRRDLNDTESEVARLKEKLEKLSFDMKTNVVRSPVHGIVKQMRIVTKGGVVKAGEPLIEITPIDDKLVIEARVHPRDIAFLRVGQHAFVWITAYNLATYGGLDGTVIEISPDAIEAAEKPGETYYRVKIQTDRSHLTKDGKPLPIGSGMTAEVSIKIGRKTLFAYILKPITRSTRKLHIEEPAAPRAEAR